MKRATWRAVVLLPAAALAAAALFIPIRDCLVARTGSGGTSAILPLSGGEPAFVVSWTHSVTRQPCAEYYRKAAGGGIELYKTVFKGNGAGLPFGDEEGRACIQDGAIVIEGLKRVLPRLDLIALPLTEHRLEVDGRLHDVLGLSAGSHRVAFTIERMPLGSIIAARAGIR